MRIEWSYNEATKDYVPTVDGSSVPITVSEWKGKWSGFGFYKGGVRVRGCADKDSAVAAVNAIIEERYDTPQWTTDPERDWVERAECWACESRYVHREKSGANEDNHGNDTMPCCWSCHEEIQVLATEAAEEMMAAHAAGMGYG